jgi:hypothetical protein
MIERKFYFCRSHNILDHDATSRRIPPGYQLMIILDAISSGWPGDRPLGTGPTAGTRQTH